MSEVSQPAQPQAETREVVLLRKLALAVLGGVLCLVLWADGMLLPSNLTTARVPGSWIRYGVETSQWSFFGEERPRSLYRSLDPFGVLWVRVPRVWLAHSYNDLHPGVQLVFSPDGSKLFVKRGTAMDERGTAPILPEPIWSDCIDVATGQSCGGVGTCCISGSMWSSGYVDEDLKKDSKKVEAIARAAGIVD